MLENEASKHYDQMECFGEDVFNAFPSVIPEITACGTCFVVRQYTASVFHALRSIELPLTRMVQSFGVEGFKNWNSPLNELETLVRDRENSRKIPNWEAQKDFYTDAINHLFAIKNAWRNYTMHLQLRFDREECEEVLLSAKAFMRKAAKIVPEEI